MHERILVTLIGNSVIANRTEEKHAEEVLNVVHQEVRESIRNAETIGDVRHSIKLRTVWTDLGR